MTKLYEIPRNSTIMMMDDDGQVMEVLFHRIDGMYSLCTSPLGPIHLNASTDVELAENGCYNLVEPDAAEFEQEESLG